MMRIEKNLIEYLELKMMNNKDLKEYHDLDKLKQYRPLPSGIVVADSGIAGQGLFTTRRLVMGTT